MKVKKPWWCDRLFEWPKETWNWLAWSQPCAQKTEVKQQIAHPHNKFQLIYRSLKKGINQSVFEKKILFNSMKINLWFIYIIPSQTHLTLFVSVVWFIIAMLLPMIITLRMTYWNLKLTWVEINPQLKNLPNKNLLLNQVTRLFQVVCLIVTWKCGELCSSILLKR